MGQPRWRRTTKNVRVEDLLRGAGQAERRESVHRSDFLHCKVIASSSESSEPAAAGSDRVTGAGAERCFAAGQLAQRRQRVSR